ncbi:RAD52 [[Candida] subhashii]|uniref:DNA repair and recombination protein RAD52 n=1 Tax=[Candida] subhashii TaxID=561895 RepID=A0A8J5QG89_9ASCO|nr:RAD52 [[Candida] subhashii]KAG7662457.1 RAD52 [[Candida] subhashii]
MPPTATKPQPRPFNPVSYTKEEEQQIQSKLDKVLGPEYVSFRPGGGGTRVSYIEGWKALNLANEIFGFNGWNSELMNTTVDYLDIDPRTGRCSLGLTIHVRVTLKDGTYHEDYGYGFIENAKSKAMAFEKCKKEAVTDGLKRCLRCFGNVLGNCLYDKSFVARIQKTKVVKPEYEDENFHRDPLLVERDRKRQIIEQNHMEEMRKEKENEQRGQQQQEQPQQQPQQQQPQPQTRPQQQEQPLQNVQLQPPPSATNPVNNNFVTPKSPSKIVHIATKQEREAFDDSFLFSDDIAEEDLLTAEPETEREASTDIDAPGTSTEISSYNNSNIAPPINAPAVFVSAKGANILQQSPDNIPPTAEFDVKFVSPNIRRTVDPTKSAPIKRSDISVNSAPSGGSSSSNLGNNNRVNLSGGSSVNPLHNSPTPGSIGMMNKLGKRVGMPPQTRSSIKRPHLDEAPNGGSSNGS